MSDSDETRNQAGSTRRPSPTRETPNRKSHSADDARRAAAAARADLNKKAAGRKPELPPTPRETQSYDGDAKSRSTLVTMALAWALFVAFLTYFNVTSSTLPYGAGPDYAAHNDGSRFIFDNGRLAKLPEDEASLKFTPYGGTRVLRPPLSYIVSAAVAKALDNGKTRLEILFRKGSALFGALTVMVTFLSLLTWFGSYRFGIFGALAVGLLPQFTFIASYNNDDAGAIFSASMMILAMVTVLRRGIGWGPLALFGLAAGLVIISKPSAWIIAPAVLLFCIVFVLRHVRTALGPIIVGIVIMCLSGGWWIASNISQYGVDDPLLLKVIKTTAAKHSRFDDDKKLGFAAHGVSMSALLANHKGFLEGTAVSTVGNLDWLRLRVGKYTYWFYYALGALGLLYWMSRAMSLVLPGSLERPRDFVFETILVFALGVQFFMYMWVNMYNDIQIQGKYLLPVVGALLILSVAGLRAVGDFFWRIADRAGIGRVSLTHGGIGLVATLGLMALTLGLHRDSLTNYVLPYYQPDGYSEPLRPLTLKPFVPVTLTPERFLESYQIEDAEFDERGKKLKFVATGNDPWFVPKLHQCGGAKDNTLVRITMIAPARGRFTIYWDDGNGFSDAQRSSARYGSGKQELHIWIAPRECRKLRFDPGLAPGKYVIHNIAVAQVDIGPATN